MTNSRQNRPADIFWQTLLSVVTGLFLLLCIVKFGNPVIFEEKILAPESLLDVIYSAWPIQWGYVAAGILLVVAFPVANWRKSAAPWWILGSLLLWFAWQFVAATHTVDAKLTSATLRHFTVCVLCFLVGYFALGEVTNRKWIWIGLLIGFVILLKAGFEQHFGGLERTRRYFELYVAPTMLQIPPGYLQKIQSNRIFGTMFYPNSMAGAILLALPVLGAFLWIVIPPRVRRVTVGALILLSLAALFWSGSKAGWLLFVLMAAVGIVHSPVNRQIKVYLVSLLVLGGVTAFGLKYAGFFQKGATSVVARTDYWKAAVQTAKNSPVFGSGPGTFMIPYGKLKAPEAEMTRLCHNDYLQQASDSGLVAFLAYSAFVGGALWFLYRQIRLKAAEKVPESGENHLEFALWLGLAILAVHSLVEFHLYIAGLAWPFFLLLGLLCGSGNQIDKTKPIGKVAAQ